MIQHLDALCDVYATPDKAKPMAWPSLKGVPRWDPDEGRYEIPDWTPPPNTGWRWIHVWASWCEPSVEEIPRLISWQRRLGADKLELVFVSVSESADDLAVLELFERSHSAHFVVSAVRLECDGGLAGHAEAQERWFAQLGLQGIPSPPIHILVDRQQRVRCVRAGGVREQDFALFERLLDQ